MIVSSRIKIPRPDNRGGCNTCQTEHGERSWIAMTMSSMWLGEMWIGWSTDGFEESDPHLPHIVFGGPDYFFQRVQIAPPSFVYSYGPSKSPTCPPPKASQTSIPLLICSSFIFCYKPLAPPEKVACYECPNSQESPGTSVWETG
jgi:hypothetical protein